MLIISEYDENDFLLDEYKINDRFFVFDGCHKIYIVEDEEDIKDVKETWGYDTTFYSIKKLPEIWHESCPLRFIYNWKLTKHYIRQCNNAEFFYKK